MDANRICPSCQKPLPPDVPLGLCPECLLKAGFNTGTGSGSENTGFIPPTVEQIAKLFPQLEVIDFIGHGGMGAVYKARQPALDRFVALKILSPRIADSPGFAERFNREARALARLVHPNIVAVHDFGKAGDLHYLIMEYVDGANLREVERAGRLAPEQALAIVPQICEALQFAHNEGIVHRDIKPENILLDKKGRVKITDFGIAKILGQTSDQASLTGAKDVVGTPHYMAPEQIESPALVDHRADIFSLGVVFYEMLTGELPLGKFQPPSQRVQMDVRLDEVVLHTLEKQPERRYQQASQVKTAVETITSSRPGPPPAVTAPELNPRQPALYLLSSMVCLAGLVLVLGFLRSGLLPGPLGYAIVVGALFALTIAVLKLAGLWPFGSPLFPKSNFTARNLRRSTQPAAISGAAPSSIQRPDLFWRRFAIVMACVVVGIPTAAAILGLLVAIAKPIFVKARERSREAPAQQLAQEGWQLKAPDAARKKLMALVEDLFQHNFRDIKSRQTLDWGDVATNANGNLSIRYKYRAKIWDKETVTNNQVFTFDPQDKFVSVTNANEHPKLKP